MSREGKEKVICLVHKSSSPWNGYRERGGIKYVFKILKFDLVTISLCIKLDMRTLLVIIAKNILAEYIDEMLLNV